MSCDRRCDKCDFTACSCLGVVISIVFGAAIGVLFAFRFIPAIVTAIWIAFGLAVLALIILTACVLLGAVSRTRAIRKCCCRNTTCLLVGIFGTIISAIVLLAIVLNPAIILIITFVAIGAFFFSLMIIGLIALISCITCEQCSRITEGEDRE